MLPPDIADFCHCGLSATTKPWSDAAFTDAIVSTRHDYHFMAKHSLSMVLLFIMAISAIRQQLRWRDYPTPISTQHALEAPKM